jgi:hypothetical protein
LSSELKSATSRFTAKKTIVLECENQEQFQEMVGLLYHHLSAQHGRRGEPPEDPGYQLAFAFRRLVDESRAISLASRYESRLHRIHERSHRTLRELQQSRKQQPVGQVNKPDAAPPPEPEPNEKIAKTNPGPKSP